MSTGAEPLLTDDPPELEEFSTRPLSLVAVAVLFILMGFLSLLGMLRSVFEKDFRFNIGVLGLFIGVGLLRHRPGWRTCALFFIYLGLVSSFFGAVVFLLISLPVELSLPGGETIELPGILRSLIAGLLFALYYWKFRILNRRDVRALFRDESPLARFRRRARARRIRAASRSKRGRHSGDPATGFEPRRAGVQGDPDG